MAGSHGETEALIMTLLSLRVSWCGAAVLFVVCLTVFRDGHTCSVSCRARLVLCTRLSVRVSWCGAAVLSVVCLTVFRDGRTARGRVTKLYIRCALP